MIHMIRRRIAIVLLTAVLTIPALSSHAQTPVAESIPAEDALAGIQAAVVRSYMPAGTFVGTGRIILDSATPQASPAIMSPLSYIAVAVREFDTADHAASALEQIRVGAEASLPGAFPDGKQKITSEELPDIGSQATLVRMDYTEPGVAVWLEYAFVQRDQYVFFVTANASVFLTMQGSGDVDTSLPTVEIAKAISIGEPSPDAPVFADDGTSTGGLWGFMLPAGDQLLMGLVPIQDGILFPVPGS